MNMTIEQAAIVLNAAVEQMTGQAPLSTIETPEQFTSVATTAIRNGYDPILNTLSMMWGRTIYSYREYTAKYDSFRWDLERYGNAVRKLSPVADGMEEDESFTWPVGYDAEQTPPLGNGESVDMYRIHKPEVLQTNFYGTAPYQQHFTIFRDQLDTAFRSADEFARFNSMIMGERWNDRESFREGVARGLQANFIGGILAENDGYRVIHLLAEYNAQTGLELTATSVYQPGNFEPFMRWVYARIATIARMFSERSNLYQTIINGKQVLRHTPSDRLRIAVLSKGMDQIRSMVLSTTFHDSYLDNVTWEAINFWQAIKFPESINIKPTYTNTNGSVVEGGNAVTSNVVFGLIHDLDAFGYAYVNEWNAMTPFNTTGGFWNEDYKARIKTISDNTEKGVVLLLD